MNRFSEHPFELGLFSFNVEGGLAQLKEPVWNATWENNVAAVRLAEEAGLEFLLPLGRWDGGSLETLTWAAAVLALTERIAVFGTLHVAFVNPVFAAKQCVTAHHVGRGRFGLNVVSGTLPSDFAFFGVPFGDHEERYEYTEEWVAIAKRLWTDDAPFDHTGAHFTLKNVLSTPKPYGGRRPMLISAGASTRGRTFAVREADALFTAITNVETLAEELRVARAVSTGTGHVPVYASGHLVTRPTRKEADEWYHHLVYDLGDWDGVEEQAAIRMRNRTVAYGSVQRLREQIISGGGTHAVRGSYDDVAQRFKELHDAGLDGMAVALVDYIGDFPALRDEVLPRMERLGLRQKTGRTASPANAG
jgi:FMNH2-dependent dimethyl sulfone monooxygenase